MKRSNYLAIAVASGCMFAWAGIAQAATVCKPRMVGQGTGMGVAGQGTVLARSNALADWSAKVATRHGKAFADGSKARSVKYDCRAGAILEAKCVVAAVPCGEVAKKKKKSKRRR